jgi:hypothetical protein
MNQLKKKMFLIKLPYWLGIAADALWAVALIFPAIYGILVGIQDFNPALEIRLIMGIAGSLMTGWTILLIWAVRKPIERKMVSLLTAFPVVFGIFIVSLTGYLNGNTSNIWLIAKTLILMILMLNSYILAGKLEPDN